MSIASEISRLQSSKADVKTQVNIDKDLINGGTAFIENETVDDYDDCIKEMQDAYKKFIPVSSESGTTSVTIDNTGNTKAITSIAFDGNTTQETYTGKNLFDKDNANILNDMYVGSSNIASATGAKTLYISCNSNTTYTISKVSSTRFAVGTTSVLPQLNTAISDRIVNLTATNITVTTSANAMYLCVFYYLSETDTISEQDVLNSIQIEKRFNSNRL